MENEEVVSLLKEIRDIEKLQICNMMPHAPNSSEISGTPECGIMSAKARLILVLAGTTTLCLVLVLLAFSSGFRTRPIANVAIPILFILGVVPIYPLLQTLRKRPPLSALAVMLLIVAVISGLASLTGSLALSQAVKWVPVASILSRVLLVASCVLFIWNGTVRGHGH